MNAPADDALTGGQYSLCRAFLGLLLAGWSGFIALRAGALAQAGRPGWGESAVALAAVAAALFLAAGALDRAAAPLLVAAGLFLERSGLIGAGGGAIAVAGVLLLHATQPGAPYGSLAALGRIEPGGGWRPRRHWRAALWAILALAQVAAAFGGRLADGLPQSFSATFVVGWPLALGLLAAAAAFVAPLRAPALVLLAGAHLVGLARGGGGADAGFLLVLPFAVDPAWFGGPTVRRAHDLVLYDGDCGLCHRAVRFLVAEDPGDVGFRFAPLGGGEAARRLGPIAARDLPDSIVVIPAAEPERHLVRSAAVLHALRRLGGFWRVIGTAGRVVPRPLGDALYDAVAGVRKRLFASPAEACPLLPPALRARFILDPPPGDEPAPGRPVPNGPATGSRPGGTPSPESPDGSPPRSE